MKSGTTAETNFKELHDLAMREGMALFGVADVKPVRDSFLIPAGIAARFDYGIALGYHLSGAVLDTINDKPNQIYYFHYQRVNILLDQTALKITAAIQARGFDAFPIPASQVTDWEKQLGSVSHRDIACRAGLGWYGKNNLLVTPEFGSQVRYATVLTNMPLTVGTPIGNGCGTCAACVARCPAGAITADGFDRDACHRKLKEFTKTEKIGQMICGVCIKTCNGGRR